MIFVDIATVLVKAGDGGNGMANFRREPYVDHGGPDGGDGGNGGNVVFVADRNMNTLANFRHRQLLKAEPGGNGAKQRKHGKTGEDLLIKVPMGTVILEDTIEIADLKDDGDRFVAASGGDGGYGNAHFTSSTRQAPDFAELGEPGEEKELNIELKMVADVGLVGLPNAGKSTFLSVVSNARPDIADYPFTTLKPNLGVADIDSSSLLISDIPGLIEGASEGKGLGDEFLRHVERTAVLIHLIDAYSNDIASDYKTITNELKSYKVDLTTRDIIVALTKTEGMDEDILEDQIKQLAEVYSGKIHAISSIAKKGVTELLRDVNKHVVDYRQKEAQARSNEDDRPVVTMSEDEFKAWTVEEKDGRFIIRGNKIEKFTRRTDFSNDQAVMRLKDIMNKMGILRELKRRNLDANQVIQIGKNEQDSFKY